jgi:hypothetical protein
MSPPRDKENDRTSPHDTVYKEEKFDSTSRTYSLYSEQIIFVGEFVSWYFEAFPRRGGRESWNSRTERWWRAVKTFSTF